MKTHELKTTAPHFEHVRSGAKRAEIRKDDRGFAVGDVLALKEYDASSRSYSGREVEARVTHVLAGFEGLSPGWVALSIACESATLSTDELAALAEARGLRLVAAEHVLDLDAARAEGAVAEREACALECDRRAKAKDESLDDVPLSHPVGRELVAARDALRDAAEVIRARSNGGAR